jgi:hypothetical protein
MSVSRRLKLSHLDTIFYEMDMLDYCFQQLLKGKWSDERDYFLCIEGFLLHYRNLIEFFGNDHDLKAGEPHDWSPRKLSPDDLASIQDVTLNKRHNGQISQYLSHCTKSRADRDRDWDHVAMYKEIEPLLQNMRKLFEAKQREIHQVNLLGGTSASTATMSVFDSMNDPDFSFRKKPSRPKKPDSG